MCHVHVYHAKESEWEQLREKYSEGERHVNVPKEQRVAMCNFLLRTHVLIEQLLHGLALGAKLALLSTANVDGARRVNNLSKALADVYYD